MSTNVKDAVHKAVESAVDEATQRSQRRTMAVAALIKAFDVALSVHDQLQRIATVGIVQTYSEVVIMASHFPDAEYALRLWASAHLIDLEDTCSTYDDGYAIRSIWARRNGMPIARVQFDREVVS